MLPKTIDRETRKEYWRVRRQSRCRQHGEIGYCSHLEIAQLGGAMIKYEYARNEDESNSSLATYWRQVRHAHLVGAAIASQESLYDDFVAFLEAASYCTRMKQVYDRKIVGKEPDNDYHSLWLCGKVPEE